MIKDVIIKEFPKININSEIPLQNVLLEMTKYSVGCCFFMNNNNLVGVLTDGDIRRLLIQKHIIENSSAQENIFGEGSLASALAPPLLPEMEEWGQEECLSREKETLGFYLSGNPLEKYL